MLAEIRRRARGGHGSDNAVHYATPTQGRLAAARAAMRARRSLDEMAGWLPPGAVAFIRTGAEMRDRFRPFPGRFSEPRCWGRMPRSTSSWSPRNSRLFERGLPPFWAAHPGDDRGEDAGQLSALN